MPEATTTVETTSAAITTNTEASESATSAEPNETEVRALQLEAQIKAMEAEQEKQRKAAAELAAENRQLKRAKMSETEQLEEQRREMEENAKKYQRLMAGAKAREVFAGSGLSEAEYSPLLELITSEDDVKTEAIAQEVKMLLAGQAKAIEKTVREKVLKETPQPPTSSGAFSNVSPQKFAEMSYRERTELYEKDPETYKKLNGGT